MRSAEVEPNGAEPPPRWRLSLFGGVELGQPGGGAAPLAGRREKGLLAYLALRPNYREKRRALTTLLWGDALDATLLDNLRTSLWGLRRALGDSARRIVVSQDDWVALAPDAFDVDVWSFRRLAGRNDRASLEAAVALYSGDFLGDFGIDSEEFQSWARDEATHFRDQAIDVLDRLAARLAETGEPDRATDASQRVLRLDPLHEGAVRRLMRLHADTGRRSMAFQLYRSLCERLNAELGAEPEAETRRIIDDISRGEDARSRGNERSQPKPAPNNPPPAAAPAAEPEAPGLPDKPSIAILPFQNLSGDPEQEYFVDGMVEEIVTALCRFRWLFVISRSSSFAYKDQAVDVRQVGRELGVRYVLEGSVRKAGGLVRIASRLTEAETGTHLWADRFDGSLEDVFDLQENIATSVAGVIEPALYSAEINRIASRPTDDLTAYDLYLRSLPHFWTLSQDGIRRALALLEQAIARDPHCGPALGWLAICHWHLTLVWPQDVATNREKAIALGQRALQSAGSDPAVIANAAMVLASCGEDLQAMTALVNRALSFNPSYGRGWYIGAVLEVYAGRHETAIEKLTVSLRLNPRDRFSAPLMVNGVADFFLRRFEAAAEKLQIFVQESPDYPIPWWMLAACYAHMGRIAEARTAAARAGFDTFSTAAVSTFRRAEDRELLLSGLRRAVGDGG